MPPIRKTTLTGKMASILERGIYSGKYVAGRRLPSTRELAKEFCVSQQVAISAFSELEEKGFVIRNSRDGVYVNPEAIASKGLEFALLVADQYENVGYASRLLSTNDTSLWNGINLAMRSISAGVKLSDALLRYEIEKIADMHPDCLIVHITSLPEDSLDLFAKLSFPTVFIGDFAWRSLPDFKFGQIVEDSEERGAAFIDAAWQCGANSLVCVEAGEEFAWTGLFNQGAQKAAKLREVDFRCVASGEKRGMTEDELSAVRRNCMAKILKEGRPDAIGFDGCGIRLFADEIAAQGLKMGRDIAVICTKYFVPGTVFIEEDFSEFSKSALALLRAVRQEPFGRRVLSGLIKRRPISIAPVRRDAAAG